MYRPMLSYSRVALARSPLLHQHRPPTSRLLLSPFLARGAANQVSHRPPSDSLEHAAQNMKEEAGHAAQDIAKIIAGANAARDPLASTSFVGMTKAIASEVPRPVMAFGLAGAVPYVGAGATTIYLAKQAGLAASGVPVGLDPGIALNIFDQALNFQVTYGAVMLSFLGALHWGMEFAEYGGRQGFKRLALGAAPVAFAWPTLMLEPMTALVTQWAGFTALWYADSKATTMGWTPKWFSQYRFYLSILVGTCIIGSLAGTTYYGPVAGHGFLSHDLDLIRAERSQLIPEREGTVRGPIEAVPAEEGDDGFVKIRKRQTTEKKD